MTFDVLLHLITNAFDMRKLKYVLFFLFLLVVHFSVAQAQLIDGCTIRAIDYSWKGAVKSWKKVSGGDTVCRMQFNSKGAVVHQQPQPIQRILPPKLVLPAQLKTEYEKAYSAAEQDSLRQHTDHLKTLEFNAKGQLTHWFTKTVRREQPTNTLDEHIPVQKQVQCWFTADGQLSTMSYYEVKSVQHYWNSVGHESPFHFSDEVTKWVVKYTYTPHGDMASFEYYESDVNRSLRNTYHYDEHNHLIDVQYYERSTGGKFIREDVAQELMNAQEKNGEQDINTVFPEFWKAIRPTSESWQYNTKGEKVQYLTHDRNNNLTFRATWEYAPDGTLWKETHFDVYHNTVKDEFWFDAHGNLQRELLYDYFNKKKYELLYVVEYGE